MDSLAKAGCLYGVELWGWQRSADMERFQSRYVKMAMGLSRNTPGYLWKLESGRRTIGIEALKRAARYACRVQSMEANRWPKICLKEEARQALNNKPTHVGKAVKKIQEETRNEKILQMIWDGAEDGDLLEELEKMLEVRIQQDIEKDQEKINESNYCPWYKEIAPEVTGATYWNDRSTKICIKEQWARLRCGNVGRRLAQGFKNVSCRACRTEEESMSHIVACDRAQSLINQERVRELRGWLEGRPGEIPLERYIVEALKGDPI
uniref:Reverse transcriptase zinc-binding domain-containing protein n=1 Tax=Bracon brevicornis TaxID=1563983 RepID=A0A6V7JW45_9HYME